MIPDFQRLPQNLESFTKPLCFSWQYRFLYNFGICSASYQNIIGKPGYETRPCLECIWERWSLNQVWLASFKELRLPLLRQPSPPGKTALVPSLESRPHRCYGRSLLECTKHFGHSEDVQKRNPPKYMCTVGKVWWRVVRLGISPWDSRQLSAS